MTTGSGPFTDPLHWSMCIGKVVVVVDPAIVMHM